MTRFERAVSSSQVTRINQVFPHTDMEQVKGIEPSSSTWQADILPLNYTYIGAGSECCPHAICLEDRDTSLLYDTDNIFIGKTCRW